MIMGKKTKFKVGDKVSVIRGTWWITGGALKWFDEDTIGSTGVVTEAETIQGIDQYALEPIIKKGNLRHAWFNNNDLELVCRPNYDGT